MQIQISWLLQKPTDLDRHCLQRQGIFWFSRTRVDLIYILLFVFCDVLLTELGSLYVSRTIILYFYNSFDWEHILGSLGLIKSVQFDTYLLGFALALLLFGLKLKQNI